MGKQLESGKRLTEDWDRRRWKVEQGVTKGISKSLIVVFPCQLAEPKLMTKAERPWRGQA